LETNLQYYTRIYIITKVNTVAFSDEKITTRPFTLLSPKIITFPIPHQHGGRTSTTVLLHKLTVTQLVKKNSPHFMEPEGSLSTVLVPILSQIDPIHALPFYALRPNLLFSDRCLGLQSGLFPSGCPSKQPNTHFSIFPHVFTATN
jgi:hypothetical protein